MSKNEKPFYLGFFDQIQKLRMTDPEKARQKLREVREILAASKQSSLRTPLPQFVAWPLAVGTVRLACRVLRRRRRAAAPVHGGICTEGAVRSGSYASLHQLFKISAPSLPVARFSGEVR